MARVRAIKPASPPTKACADDQVMNPKTKRCVSKEGKIGKELLKAAKAVAPSPAPAALPSPVKAVKKVAEKKTKVVEKKAKTVKKVVEKKAKTPSPVRKSPSPSPSPSPMLGYTPKNPQSTKTHNFYKEGNDNFIYAVDRAPTSRASCQLCKEKIEKGELRMCRYQANPFGDGPMPKYYHVDHAFVSFLNSKCDSAHITWDKLSISHLSVSQDEK